MDGVCQPGLFGELPDCAAESDDRALAIDKVGIKDLSYPIQVLDKNHDVQHTVANVSLYVSLPHHFKGTHMSRFVEILNARRGEMTIRNMPGILSEVQHRLDAEDAHIELSFPYFLSKRAPVSGVESLMEYLCWFHASKKGPHVDFLLGVQVPVKSLCPCSKAISEAGAHNQRSLVEVEIRSSTFLWIEDVIAAAEACASAPLYALLKREDEKYITELAYHNPKFVEDLVRDTVLAVRELEGVQWLKVSAENQESIHKHSAYAEIEWSLEDERVGRQMEFEFSPEDEPEAPSFGGWLRQQRAARNFRQQELADHLGVSASFLSRVENDEKGLSEVALGRLAELLGLDPDEVMLRAGLVPEQLRALFAKDPRRVLAWGRRQ
jgi:GTP cyclohydrolase I